MTLKNTINKILNESSANGIKKIMQSEYRAHVKKIIQNATNALEQSHARVVSRRENLDHQVYEIILDFGPIAPDAPDTPDAPETEPQLDPYMGDIFWDALSYEFNQTITRQGQYPLERNSAIRVSFELDDTSMSVYFAMSKHDVKPLF